MTAKLAKRRPHKCLLKKEHRICKVCLQINPDHPYNESKIVQINGRNILLLTSGLLHAQAVWYNVNDGKTILEFSARSIDEAKYFLETFPEVIALAEQTDTDGYWLVSWADATNNWKDYQQEFISRFDRTRKCAICRQKFYRDNLLLVKKPSFKYKLLVCPKCLDLYKNTNIIRVRQ